MAGPIGIDLRLLGASGIGRYLREVVPRVVRTRPGRYAALGRREEVSGAGLLGAVDLVEAGAPMYTVREQWELLRRIPPDVHTFWSPHYTVPLRSRGALVVTIHDVAHLALPKLFGGAHRRVYARAMFGLVRRKAAAVLCDSAFTAGELARLAGVPLERMVVAYPGVDAEWFATEESPPPLNRPYLLYVGNVKPHKNVGALVQAFEGIADRVPHDLVIVGRREGFLTGDAGAGIAGSALRDRIRFTGEIPDRSLRAYLQHGAALVHPSLYEGFGLPPLEAMAAGCPAIVSRAASLPEVCGDAADYFDPHDRADMAAAILRVLRDRSRRDELVARGRERVRRFSWDECAQTTAEVLSSVADRTGGPDQPPPTPAPEAA